MYAVEITTYAKKQFKQIGSEAQAKLTAAIRKLANNPRPHGYIKMKGREAYRIKVGDYRIIYEIHDQQLLVLVVEMGHRRDIYE
jgi:mRNA interferase RelE/StbE